MLPPRLKLIYDHADSDIIADIGTDHAHIPIKLIKSGKCKKAIASDINEGPAKIAAENIKRENLNIEVRTGPGLTVLNENEVEQIIIAGMGGKLIVDILKESYDIAINSKLILQPMSGQYELRKYLVENNFIITDEDITIEGEKIYNLIKVNPSGISVAYNTEFEFHIPEFLKKHKYYEKLKEKKLREFNKILDGNKKSSTLNRNAIDYYEKMIELCMRG